MAPSRRVLGLETEYAYVFTPEVGSNSPAQDTVHQAFSEVLQEEYLCCEAAYRKGGYFLANGGLVHYEAEADAVHRGLLEMATPECSSATEAVAHHRAQERIIKTLLPKVNRRLAEEGFAGNLFIGKASSDYQGHTFGTHENYLVDDRLGVGRSVLLVLLVGLFHVFRLPLSLGYLILSAFSVVVYGAAFGVFVCVSFRRRLCPSAASAASAAPEETSTPRTVVRLQDLIEKISSGVFRLRLVEQKYLFPLFSRWITRLILRVYREHLVPFLVTRLVFTGPGWLKTDSPEEGVRFVLSPKAAAVGVVMDVYSDASKKPIIDVKNLFRESMSLLRRHKRLHVSFSDSNMSEYALWLKLSTTDLVLRMLEAGFIPKGCGLQDPIEAIRVVSGDLTFGRSLSCLGGGDRTALEIQRAYFETARQYVCERAPEDMEARTTLDAWDRVLRALEEDSRTLVDVLDWVAKKDLMDEAVMGVGWEELEKALSPLRYLEEKNVGLGRMINAPTQVAKFLKARLGADFEGLEQRMKLASLSFESLPELYRLFYQLKKIDLRYHEIGAEGGYYLQMEQEGLFRRVVSEADVEQARLCPPGATRAALRGRYIQDAARLGLDILVGWERVIVPTHFKIIRMDDPCALIPPVRLDELQSQNRFWRYLRMLPFLPHLAAPY